MAQQTRALAVFNRGIISRRGIARVDLERTSVSAEIMTNWMPVSLGPMSLRQGMGYIGNSNDDAKARYLPFVFATDDTAHLEFTALVMRVRIDDVLITRPTVTAAVTNGGFTGNIVGWTDNDEGSATSVHSSNRLAQTGSGSSAAIVDQQVTVNQAGTEHALRIVVERGPVILRVGSSTGDDSYIAETTLGTGTHSLAFTPTGNFHIRIMTRRDFTTYVDSVTVEAAGVMEVPAPWTEADQPLMRRSQSGDVIYITCEDKQQYRIERRSARSWSVVKYEPETGPFRTLNTTTTTMAPSALVGNITLTASRAYFKSTNVGSLIRIQSVGQTVTETISAENTFSDPIRVAGIGGQRLFGVQIAGTFVATVTLQYSVGEPGNWVDQTTYTIATSTSFDDGQDNQVIYYRIGVKTGNFTSGSLVATLSYTSGSIIGVARITAFTSTTVVDAIVLQDFGSLTASSDWWEGKWSDRRGWPSALALHELRMAMFGRDSIDLSITDQFEDFDDEFEGDAGPINRSIGEGPVDTITWALSLTRLVFGTVANSANIEALKISGNNPMSCRSSSLDEPLTPTNFKVQTSAPTGMFVDTSLTRLMELVFDINEGDYVGRDMCAAVPDLNEAGIVGIAVQYKPDIRIWAWREDGTVGLLVRDRAEDVLCWCEIETDGLIEDVSVLPGFVEDRVYFSVLRGTSRFLEKLALSSECVGGTVNKQADAFITGTNSPASATITGLGIHEGKAVIAWADGVDFSPDDEDTFEQTTYTVSGGAITLPEAVTNWVVGRPFEATWKSGKLAFAAALGTSLNVEGKNAKIGFVLQDTHAKGLRYGSMFDGEEDGFLMDPLPAVENEEEVDADAIHEEYDEPTMTIESDWQTDPRVCLLARAPRPCTVKAISIPLRKSG